MRPVFRTFTKMLVRAEDQLLKIAIFPAAGLGKAIRHRSKGIGMDHHSFDTLTTLIHGR